LGLFVNGTGDEFFACAGFPGNQNVELLGPTLAIRERTIFRDLDVPTISSNIEAWSISSQRATFSC
jgi:hypothetical protein